MTTNFDDSSGSPADSNGSRLHQTSRAIIDVVPARYLQRNPVLGRFFALLLFLLCSPIIGILIVIVRLGSRGPGLYTQVRVGKSGDIFVMYKIRSMVQDAEETTGPVWTNDNNDPRITRIGRFLRKSHLDELPQLLNVVRGEMALFGPRPERPELVQVLAESVPGYLNRLAVRPGITGLAQINLPPDTNIESVRRKLRLDLEYIKHANLTLDLRIFLWTGLRLLAVPASFATRVMGLGRDVKPFEEDAGGPVTIDRILTTTGHRGTSPNGWNGNSTHDAHPGTETPLPAVAPSVPAAGGSPASSPVKR